MEPIIFTSCIRLSNRLATLATRIAKIPHAKVNHLVATTKCLSDFTDTFLLYKSMVVVEARAFNSDAVDDIAADNITANNKPIKPRGKLFKIK